MVQVEFTIYPFQEGNSPPAHVQAAIDVLSASGLDVDVGPLSTTVSGPADEVFDAVRSAQSAAVAAGAERIVVRVEVIG
ncbi:MAG TPA: thiamine-binding protein [Actinomycetota bacterium]